MDKNLLKLRKLIYEEISHYFAKSQKDSLWFDPGQRDVNDNEPFNPDLNGLSIAQLKYEMYDLPKNLSIILNAPDAKIIREPDQQDGIYSVYSKSLNNHFEFSYKHEYFDDWTIIEHDKTNF